MTSFLRFFCYSKINAQEAATIIRAGTFCRTLWPIFPPILFYQYIRQKDLDKKTTEMLYLNSSSTKPEAFENLRRPKNSGHWAIQRDLDIIWKAANPGLHH